MLIRCIGQGRTGAGHGTEADVAFHDSAAGARLGHDQRTRMRDRAVLAASRDEEQADRIRQRGHDGPARQALVPSLVPRELRLDVPLNHPEDEEEAPVEERKRLRKK